MGIGGGVVGGFAMSFAGLGGYRGTIITTLVAMVGAVLLTCARRLREWQKALRPPSLAYARSQVEALEPFRQFCRRPTSLPTDVCVSKL